MKFSKKYKQKQLLIEKYHVFIPNGFNSIFDYKNYLCSVIQNCLKASSTVELYKYSKNKEIKFKHTTISKPIIPNIDNIELYIGIIDDEQYGVDAINISTPNCEEIEFINDQHKQKLYSRENL